LRASRIASRITLEFGLMSACTSFVAVDSSQVTAGDRGTTVDVPVPVPDGVHYDTTVMEGAKQSMHVE
jgi:Ca-activated chloride channel homolog